MNVVRTGDGRFVEVQAQPRASPSTAPNSTPCSARCRSEETSVWPWGRGSRAARAVARPGRRHTPLRAPWSSPSRRGGGAISMPGRRWAVGVGSVGRASGARRTRPGPRRTPATALTDPAVLIAEFSAAAGALQHGWLAVHPAWRASVRSASSGGPASVPSTPSPSASARPPLPGPEWSSRSARWDRTAMHGSGRGTTRHPGGLPWPRAFWHTRSSGHGLASPSSMRRA
jgi:hypothetical protein